MKRYTPLISALVLSLLGTSYAANAADDGWKRGRVYYRMVCTACHASPEGGDKAIGPNLKTKAEWAAYIQADKHAKGKDSLKYYISKEYRAKIKASNKAAEKYADVPDADLMNDIKAFVAKGAKDGDSPAGCD
jgi:cytochrome c2